MKRTNSIRRFAAGNRRLLLMAALMLGGYAIGLMVYASWGDRLPTALTTLLVIDGVEATLQGVTAQFFSSCFQAVCLLLVLFLGGLSACSAPIGLLVPVFWGMGLGVSAAHLYTQGIRGLLCAAVLLVPPSLFKGAVLLLGAVQSWQLSLQLAGQLLPRSAHIGGLWQSVRLFCVRFLLLLPLLFAACALDVGLRLCLFRFF